MFSIIIPNYNNAAWLDRCLSSVLKQKYKDYEIIVVDDCSTDSSRDILHAYYNDKIDTISYERRKRYNGGARNVGMAFTHKKYVLFMDSDDCLADDMCLTEIDKIIKTNNYPDLVRLSYYYCENGQEQLVDLSDQDTPEKITHDVNVACWTKCIKRDKFVKFPENTLMEDVVQHIAQMDDIESVAVCHKGIVVWNRDNTNSTSRKKDDKWRSSLYRYYADLLDLTVTKPYCQAELEKRRANALRNIKNNRFEQE